MMAPMGPPRKPPMTAPVVPPPVAPITAPASALELDSTPTTLSWANAGTAATSESAATEARRIFFIFLISFVSD
jgi:hypothetical protein